MRKLFVLMAACWMAAAFANTSIDKQLQAVARQQLSAMGIAEQPEKLADADAYAIFGAEAGGFVIVSKQPGSHSVLGYSHSVYRPDVQPCGFRWWLDAVERSAKSGRQHRAAKKYHPVDNFMNGIQWGQDAPYNEKCPVIGGEHAPSGCIATAMAQVMRYFEYPAQGQGMGSYTITTGGKSEVIEEEINGTYLWDQMPKIPYSAATKVSIRNAVSTLLFDCGKAVKMGYAADGSGAYEWDQALAMTRVFQYDSLALNFCVRDYYSDKEWMELIDEELQQEYPILYCGADEESGHAFLFSGIDADGKVYVNWGWDGVYDGYYAIDELEPVDAVYGKWGYFFQYQHSMLLGIRPHATPDAQYRSKWASLVPLSEARASNDAKGLTLNDVGLANIHFLPFTGTLGWIFESTDDAGRSFYSEVYDVTDMVVDTYNYLYEEEPVTITLDDVPAGCYSLRWASKDSREDEAQPMREEGGNVSVLYIAKREDGTILTGDKPFVSGISEVRFDASAPVRYYDMQGRQTDGAHRGLTIIRQGNRVRKIRL